MSNDSALMKPALRGHFHEAAFYAAIGACLMLIARAQSGLALGAAIIYSLSLITMFGVSALYHRRNWQEKARMWLRRLDHSAIFILIAGTGTPIFMLSLEESVGVKLLWIVWSVTFVGILQSLFWVKAPKWVSAILYVLAGWAVVPYLSPMKEALGENSVYLLLIGGVAYTVGALVYALKKPNPWPSTFGYHEIFHILVVIAAVFHFVVIYRIVS